MTRPFAAVSPVSERSLAALPAGLLIVSMATFIQAYLAVKLFFLVAFVVASTLMIARGRRVSVHPPLVMFYVALSILALVWSVIGLLHGANHWTGVFDAIRLYCVWSGAFVLLYTLLRAERSLEIMHWAMVVSGILISVVNLGGLASQFFGWGFVSDAMREELNQYIGFHEGYIQITSKNLGAMFLVVPYLIALQFRADADRALRWPMRLSLSLSLILVAVSGRRALWLTVALVPLTLLVLAVFTGSLSRMATLGRRALIAYASAVVLAVALTPVLQVLPESLQSAGPTQYLQAAFSAQDERSIQQGYLQEAFAEAPVMGMGFGSTARYLRDYERPWTGYELTYFQMLFNLGVVGVALVGGLFAAYFVGVVRILRRFPEGSAVPFGLLVAFCSLLLGGYTNRYFGSFDLLFFLGFLPFLSTFGDGFGSSSAYGRAQPSS